MEREFPSHPVLCVGAVVIEGSSVLLVRRGHEPQKGAWTIPGGRVKLGERVSAAVRREIKEETGLRVEPLALALVFERINRQNGRVRYHYTVLDYVCRAKGGRLKAGSDAVDARWVQRNSLAWYHLSPQALSAIRRGFRLI